MIGPFEFQVAAGEQAKFCVHSLRKQNPDNCRVSILIFKSQIIFLHSESFSTMSQHDFVNNPSDALQVITEAISTEDCRYNVEIQIYSAITLIKTVPAARIPAIMHLEKLILDFLKSSKMLNSGLGQNLAGNYNSKHASYLENFKSVLNEIRSTIKIDKESQPKPSESYWIEYLRKWSLNILRKIHLKQELQQNAAPAQSLHKNNCQITSEIISLFTHTSFIHINFKSMQDLFNYVIDTNSDWILMQENSGTNLEEILKILIQLYLNDGYHPDQLIKEEIGLDGDSSQILGQFSDSANKESYNYLKILSFYGNLYTEKVGNLLLNFSPKILAKLSMENLKLSNFILNNSPEKIINILKIDNLLNLAYLIKSTTHGLIFIKKLINMLEKYDLEVNEVNEICNLALTNLPKKLNVNLKSLNFINDLMKHSTEMSLNLNDTQIMNQSLYSLQQQNPIKNLANVLLDSCTVLNFYNWYKIQDASDFQNEIIFHSFIKLNPTCHIGKGFEKS